MNNLSGAKIPNIYYMEEFNNIKLLNIAYLEFSNNQEIQLSNLLLKPIDAWRRNNLCYPFQPSKPKEGDMSHQEPLTHKWMINHPPTPSKSPHIASDVTFSLWTLFKCSLNVTWMLYECYISFLFLFTPQISQTPSV